MHNEERDTLHVLATRDVVVLVNTVHMDAESALWKHDELVQMDLRSGVRTVRRV